MTARGFFGKVARVGRASVFVLGAAMVLTVVLGFATAALAAVPGDPFRLGRINAVNTLTQLVGEKSGPMLRIDNDGQGYALQLLVEPGKPSLVVDADAGKALNLNADELDGQNPRAFFTGATYRNTGNTFGVLAPGTNQSYVQCDGPEDRALGGGYSDVAEGIHITESSPYVAPEANVEGWEFRWLDNNDSVDEWVTEVVCADFPPMHGSSGS